MKIVATVLTHNCGQTVVPAIASVLDQVDLVLVIDTERGGNPSVTLAKQIAGPKYRGRQLMLRRDESVATLHSGWNGSFADARNFALHMAGVLGADWMLTIDTDERIDWGDLSLRATL